MTPKEKTHGNRLYLARCARRRYRPRGQITEEGVTKAGDRREEFTRAYGLAGVRKSLGTRQIDSASLIGVSQAMVSKLERGDIGHTEIGTSRSYIAALGGRLEVRANFGDET